MGGNNNNTKYRNFMLLIGIIGSALFLYIGYLLSGVLGFMTDKGYGFTKALEKVISNPVDNYFNSLSPVTMIIGFLLYELFFIVILLNGMKKRSESGSADNTNDEILDTASDTEFDDNDVSDLFDDSILDSGLDSDDLVNSDDYVYANEAIGDSGDGTGIIAKPPKASFDDMIVSELLDLYDISQITAMLRLTSFMEIDEAGLLKKMFPPDLSAEDIEEYIDIFYGGIQYE